MKQGMTNRVTSLSFSHYNPEDYILDHELGMKLSSINKILLNLFNNDLYAYTILVGKMKGLWWKYWFADATRPGYSSGDMVYVNGVQETQFLRKYWKSVQQIANYNVVLNRLPDFRSNDDDIVSRYANALGSYFHLGNRGMDGQIYISLKDDNKDPVPVTASWQPYIVTNEELRRREYQLSDLLEDSVRLHNSNYHVGLDALDAMDSGYEVDNNPVSIYNPELGKYLPKVRIADEEHQSWVDFASSPAFNKLLGFGAISFDFLHIVKPLGTDSHRIETWVGTDGHVSVRGYVPVAMLTEIIPEIGSIEYNQWKMGGTRRFGMRLDYSISNSISKLYFSKGSDDTIDSLISETEQSFGLARRSALKRMIDEEEHDPFESIYKIVSYNEESGGMVLFHPNACDFDFSDIVSHPDVLKPGDPEILANLLNEEKYSHAVNSAQGDEPECHFFSKNRVQKNAERVPISPVDVSKDDNPAIVASEIRLLRNFGITRSPALKTVLSQSVFPDSSELISPMFMKPPSIHVSGWTWAGGQSVIFEVPSNVQNIRFELDGMMKEDNIDFSVYDIRKGDGYNLQWVHDLVMNYEFPKAVIMAAYANGLEEEWNLPRLIGNMSGMMSKIEHCVIDYPTFISFMQFRTLDIAPLDGLLGQLRSRVNWYLRDDDPLGTEEFRKHAKTLEKLYAYVYDYIAEKMRFKALHDCYSELMSGAVTTEKSRVVMVHRLQGYLRDNQMRREGNTPDDWISEVEEAMKEAENEIVPLVNDGDDATADEYSSVLKRLKSLHEAYVAERELESKPLDSLPNLEPDSQEYLDELKKYQDRYLSNFMEIDAYLQEVEDTLESATETRERINDYLQVEWLDEMTKIYLNYQLSKLNDSMERYRTANIRICDGYDKYMRRWMSIMGIDGSTELKEGFTVNDLISGSAPLRSLKTMKSRLEAFA